jgi:hypothetical protein
MKKSSIVLFVCLMIMLAGSLSEVFATGSCVKTNVEDGYMDGAHQRRYITLTCTGDGTIGAYSFNPAAQGVRFWYLYNITTDPDGTSAPTVDYDITLLATGEDIAGGLLADRSATARQTVAICPTTLGYHMNDGTIAITFANQTASPSIIVMTLRFTKN